MGFDIAGTYDEVELAHSLTLRLDHAHKALDEAVAEAYG